MINDLRFLTLGMVLGGVLVSSCVAGDDSEALQEQHRRAELPVLAPDVDSVAAVQAADSLLSARYGTDAVRRQLPLTASLRDSVWVVLGTLPEGYTGGVGRVEIVQATGRVIRVSHGM